MNTQVLAFYGYWQLVVCFFAFLGLISIWFHLGRKQKDTGQVWLALSILCWSLSGGLIVLFTQNSDFNQSYLNGGKSILSLLNSFFILLSLPYFRHLPRLLEGIIKSKFWLMLIGLPFVFSLLPTLSKLLMNSSHQMISELDVYYSILTLLILGWVLWESFAKRKLIFLASLSIVCIAITFIAELYKLSNNEFNQLLLAAIFKSCLIMLFFALALSWVKDLTETISASVKTLKLNMNKLKGETGKWIHQVNFQGLFDDEKELQLSKTHYELLARFVHKRKTTPEGWMEIKPKSEARSNKVYDIKDYNEIKRLVHGILDEQFGKAHWTKTQHEQPLKDLLFERSPGRERKIRLSLQKDNISLPELPTT